MISRRKMLKFLAGLPLAGAMGMTSSEARTSTLAPARSPDLFKELDIKTIVNARGTWTYLGGSLMLPEVKEAIMSTSNDFANLHEIEDKIGARIAGMLEADAAMVTAGAACALTLGTAACITGDNQDLIDTLPDIPGPRREVIMQKSHRYAFDHAVRIAGIKIVEVEGAREMEQSINGNTVMALYLNEAVNHSPISREEFVAIGKRHNVPTFIDCADNVPPMENLFKFQKMGFDLVTISGGKMIRAPQSTGLLLGRKDLIEAAKLNFDPYECPIGRPMKVNKEEMFGMYAALKAYLARDHEKEWQEWIDRTRHIAGIVEAVPTVKGETYLNPGPGNQFPFLHVSWDQDKVKLTPKEANEALMAGTPRIEAVAGEKLEVAVVTLRQDQVDILAYRLKEVLENATA